jgi:hypothetical protein
VRGACPPTRWRDRGEVEFLSKNKKGKDASMTREPYLWKKDGVMVTKVLKITKNPIN